MRAVQKITLFYFLLLANHVFHTVEVYYRGYEQGETLIIGSSKLFLLIQLVILLVLLFFARGLQRRTPWSLIAVRAVAVLFLLYGVVLAFGNVYRKESVIGSFSGFIHVMISLPLILWISDYIKKRES